MLNLTNLALADSFVADAERRWLYGHPYRVERGARGVPPVGRRAAARARRPAAGRRLRAA